MLLLHLMTLWPLIQTRMNSTLIISLIAATIVISMVASGISYSRQQAMKKRQLRITKLRQQADELLSYTSLLLKIDKQYDLIIQLQSLAVSCLQGAKQIAPDDPLINNHLQAQEIKLHSFKSCERDNKITCYVSSDTELSQAQSQLGQISKLIDIYRNKGLLPSAKSQELQAQLQMIKVELNINSNLYQADCFAEEGDMTMYQMHIKQALDLLKKTNIDGANKNDRIRQLSTLLNEAKRTNRVVGDGNLIKPEPHKNKPKSNSQPTNDSQAVKKKPTDTEAPNDQKEKW
jgi:predicted S18 family serine protease